MDVIQINRFKCSICSKEYDTYNEAISCFNRGFNPKYKVGDYIRIVLKENEDTTGWMYSIKETCYGK